MSAIDTAITYLVNKKFGLVATLAPALGSLNLNVNERNVMSKQEAEIEEYKRSLRNMPETELLALHKRLLTEDRERARVNAIREENERFYNLKSADADYAHWSKAAHWTIDEATALSLGKEPEVVTWAKIERYKDKSAFVKTFAKRRDLAMRATRWKKFHDLIPPITFIGWAKEIHLDLPQELISEVEKIGGIAINWHDQYWKLKAEIDASAGKQKPESTRKTENLLQALTCIAVDAYGYDPQSMKSTAPQDIADALAKHGKRLDAKTIRGWLKEGSDLLPPNPDAD